MHGLGRWAVAAIDPQWLADWLAEPVVARRREIERRTLGTELTSLGRVLAERWGCDPLVVDAAWLHDGHDRALNGCASDPKRLALIQEAFAWAERTPWALDTPEPRDPHAADPRLRLLIAEVQVRCGSALVEPDATPYEERLSRSNARLRRQLSPAPGAPAFARSIPRCAGRSEPTESPETWAERAGLSWCGEPGVTAARVVWSGPGSGAPGEASEPVAVRDPPAR